MDEHFRSHILWSPNETECPTLIFLHLLASSHIHQLEIAVSANHYVFGLEVSIDDALLMEHL